MVSEQMVGETLKERVAKLEQLMGEWNCEEGTVTAWASEAMNELRVQRESRRGLRLHLEGVGLLPLLVVRLTRETRQGFPNG